MEMKKRCIKSKLKFLFPILIMIMTLYFSMAVQKKQVHVDKQRGEGAEVIHADTKPVGEMRAVWITFMTLDMKNTDMSKKSFEEKFHGVVEQATQMGLNTLIVHVRPYSDAMYPSKIFPWSHLLTGYQGKDPGYDPLKYMIDECHKYKMKFHAWVNPLRIQLNGTPSKLADNNLYNKKDELGENSFMEDDKGKYLDPSNVKVREKIIDGVREIVENYEVDGIHFDDYFYPTNNPEIDNDSYNKYKNFACESGVPLSKDVWRKSNINALISGTYSAIKSISKEVQFGISPQGNIQNDLSMGADVNYWGSVLGFVDYLCPQIYVSFNHPVLPFDNTAKQWRDLVKCSDIDLYYGLGVYKVGTDADQGSWRGADDILKREIEYGRSLGSNGFMLYSWDSIKEKFDDPEIVNVVKVLSPSDQR